MARYLYNGFCFDSLAAAEKARADDDGGWEDGRRRQIFEDNSPSKSYKVVCEDGRERGGPFDTYAAAEHFAAWGHCCTTSHQIVPVAR